MLMLNTIYSPHQNVYPCAFNHYYFYYQLDNMIMFSDALAFTTYIGTHIYLKQTILTFLYATLHILGHCTSL